MNDEMQTIDIPEEGLQHYGVGVLEGAPGRGSGRYPLGSGEAAYQRMVNLRTTVATLRKSGMSDKQIAEHLQFRNTCELRSRIAKNRGEIHAYEVARALKLKDKQMSNVAIARLMFKDDSKESTVRNLLKEAERNRQGKFAEVTSLLKAELEKHPYLDVGEGTNLSYDISEDRLKKILTQMEQDGGYKVHSDIVVEQYGVAGLKKTTNKILTKADISDRDVYQHLDEVRPAGFYLDKDTDSIRQIEPPASIDGKRVYIRYAEQGGTDKDGLIEIRPGVEDLSLGKAHYAQVRIAVDGKSYLKGMALYSDKIPEGYDVVFNTNKHEGTPMEKVLKPLNTTKDGEIDIANPFKASIKTEDQLKLANESEGSIRRQRHYIGADGQEHLSAINIVNEEGAWNEWSRNISAQMLSKQPPALAKRQLDLAYQVKKEQFDELSSLTNPTVKKQLLQSFADECDHDAVHLKAFGFPGQTTKVLLPVDSLKDNECYCPTYDTGTPVVAIRFPHAHISEIASMTVNNNHREAKKILGQAIDAIGINSNVARKLSGADYDGDTVVVIPNKDGAIKFVKTLEGLKNFDPSEAYPKYPGMRVMKESTKQREMGIVSNLITDMTVAGANEQELTRAIKHSMVVIDAVKHELDYKRSERENNIDGLKAKYQQHPYDDDYGGASTLLSKSKSTTYIPDRRLKGIDPATGRKIWEDTGKLTRKGTLKMIESDQMSDTDDARTLISKYNSQQERVYANFANQMKQMALDARKEAVTTPPLKKNPEAAKQYASEVASLTVKLRTALRNKPLERMAQRLANVEVRQHIYDNPELKTREKRGELKKLKGRTLQYMRERTGANKTKVTFTDAEWKAVQSGAVSNSFLERLLKNADDKHVKQLSMPRERQTLSPARRSRVENMLARGYTYAEVAKTLDIPMGTVQGVAMEMR